MSNRTVYQELGIEPAGSSNPDLIAAWIICFGSLALAFPFYSYLAFGLDMDRGGIANIFATQVTIAYWLGICAAFLPLPSLENWSTLRRIHSVCLAFMFVSYITLMLLMEFHKILASSIGEEYFKVSFCSFVLKSMLLWQPE